MTYTKYGSRAAILELDWRSSSATWRTEQKHVGSWLQQRKVSVTTHTVCKNVKKGKKTEMSF